MNTSKVLCALLCIWLAGCGSDETKPQETTPWRMPLAQLPGALISVTGTASDDVWLVGGDPGDGKGGMLLHYDGAELKRIANTAPDLWWAHGFAGGPVFISGAQGTILEWSGGKLSKMPTPSNQGIVFGVWGADPNDLWAVGGDAFGGNAFVWRYDGTAWADAPNLPAMPISQYFKVWGTSASDVRIVGADGVALHYDGKAFQVLPTPTTFRLLTTHTNGDGLWAAVGAGSRGVILEDSGSGFVDVSPSESPKALFGVRLAADSGYAVGVNGTLLRRAAGVWRDEKHGLDVFDDFHAVWIDPDAGVWAVGGAVFAPPLVDGMLLYKGKQDLPSTYVD